MTFDNSTHLQSTCINTCGPNCVAGSLLTVVGLIWCCYICGLCFREKVRKEITYIRQINEPDQLIVVGENIEKPPEYIQ